jgi:hypothetical protein
MLNLLIISDMLLCHTIVGIMGGVIMMTAASTNDIFWISAGAGMACGLGTLILVGLGKLDRHY